MGDQNDIEYPVAIPPVFGKDVEAFLPVHRGDCLRAPVYHAPQSLAFQEETTPGHATVIAANAITELTSDTATAEEAEERELQGPVWWALAPPAASVSGYPILATR